MIGWDTEWGSNMASLNLSLPDEMWTLLIHLDPRHLVRQTAFCDPQTPQYSAVLEKIFLPAN